MLAEHEQGTYQQPPGLCVCWGYVCGELTLLKKQQKSLLGWVLDGMGSHCLSPLGLTGCLPPTVLQAGESKTVALELNI